MKLPSQINLTNGRWIKMYYDGGGKLLKREFSTGEYWEFYGGVVYKNAQPYSVANEEGRATNTSTNGTVVWDFEYFYTDHLGNARASFSAEGQNLVVKDISDFDPTGIPLNGIGIANATENRFKYQNKESLALFGLSGINDFSARYADKTINRFWGVDALAEINIESSPFALSNNNPLRFIDPDGMDAKETNDFDFSDGYSTQSYNNTTANVAVSGNYQNVDPNNRVILIGGANLSINGTDISEETQKIYNGIDKEKTFDTKAYNHPYILQSDDSFINDVVAEVLGEYKSGQALIFYGYSKGGELALRIVRELDKKNIPVELLITVDAAYPPNQPHVLS